MRSIDHHQLVPSPCPSEQLWGNYLSGSVELVTLNAMSAHLETCSGCAQVLDDLSARSPNVQNAVRSPYLDEPNFIRMVARVEELRIASDAGDTVVDRALRRKDDAEERAPAIVGRFLVRRVLGAGGFGRVYLATDPLLNRSVAIKAPRHSEFDSEGDLSSFLSEARHAAALDHPGIVPIFDVLADDSGRTLIVMKYIEGESLAAHLQKGPLGLEKTVRIMVQVARAMHFAHERGFVHRDLKPANILMDEHGTPHVSDLGLGLNLDQRDEKVLRGGTPAYMSPEQIRHDVISIDRRSDVWSLGVMLAELVHGRRPFPQKERHELFKAILTDEPLIESAPETKALDAVIRQCLSKSPTDRYSTADLLAVDLTHWLRRNFPSGVEKWRYGWRRNLIAATISVLVIGSIAFGRVQLKQRELRFNLSQLESSPVNQVAKLVARLKSNRVTANSIAGYGRPSDLAGQFRLDVASIAVGDQNEETLKRCVDAMQTTEPEEIAAVVEILGSSDSTSKIADEIAGRFADADFDEAKFRLSAALAGFGSTHAIWDTIQQSTAQRLVTLEGNDQARWLPLFDAVGDSHLAGSLHSFMKDRTLETHIRVSASHALARYLASEPMHLAAVVGDADSQELQELMAGLKVNRHESIRCLEQLFKEQFTLHQAVPNNDWAPPTDRDLRAASFAVALWLLGSYEACFETLQHSPDPTLQTLVIHGIAQQDVDATSVARVLKLTRRDDTHSRAVQFGLLQVLAELPVDAVHAREANEVLRELLNELQLSPDSGVHSMVRLIASRYGVELSLLKPAIYGQWLVDQIGDSVQDFSIIEPCTVEVGIHKGQPPPSGTASWLRHKRNFPHRIAVASNEITIEQFRVFDRPYIDDLIARNDLMLLESAPDAAMMVVTIEAAHRFCNSWSNAAGLETCYEPKANERGETLLVPKDNFTQLSGYRLPTDGEWELVCRAGSETSRYFGNAHELVSQYAWTLERKSMFALASNRTAILSQRIAQLIPNRWGMFDMYGNATELCEMGVAPTDSHTEVLDALTNDSTPSPGLPLVRGASLTMPGLQYAHSHCRTNSIGGTYSRDFGIRVVRTLTVDGVSSRDVAQ